MGSAAIIREVADIIATYKAQQIHVVVVSSAMSGVTNQLLKVGHMASENDETYLDILREIEALHFKTIKELIAVKNQSHVLAGVKKMINELEDLMHGVFLLKELSLRTTDLLLSFGERMSCFIIHEYAIQEGLDTELLDARMVIRTDNRFGKARVDDAITHR